MGIRFAMLYRGLRRRKREMRYVSIAAFTAVLFMSAITLLQTVMDRYLMETNYQNYGDWAISAVRDYENPGILFSELKHPYLKTQGVCKTGAELLDQNNAPSGVLCGTVDEALREFGNLTLYEGRFPAAEDEIAMDLSALSAMGLRYELGQNVRIAVFADGEVREKEFLLTGSMRSFAKTWKQQGGYPLPGCILTEEGLKSVCKPAYATYFYQLDRRYENLDMEEFAAAFLLPDHLRTYNSYVYENRVWGSGDMFRAVKLLLTCMGALCVGYLMASYVSGRRMWYYKLRALGADRTQVKGMIVLEAAYGVVPGALLGMAIPCMAGAAVCGILAKRMQIPFFFVVHPADVFSQLCAIFGMFLCVVCVAWINGRDQNLVKNSREVTGRQIRRLRRDAKKGKNTAKIFLKRIRKLHPFQRLSFLAFSAAVCLLLSLCLNQIVHASSEYAYAKENNHDYSALKESRQLRITPYQDGGSAGGDMRFSMYDGMSREMEREMASLIGIERMRRGVKDEMHILQWERKKDSPIEQRVKELYEQNIVQYANTMFVYEEDDQKLLSDLKQDFDLDGLEEDAFLKGEAIVLMLSAYEDSFWKAGEKISETTLHPGDMVDITDITQQCYVPCIIEGADALPGRVSVKTGAVIQEPPMKWRMQGGMMANYTVFASKKLAERVAKADGKPFFYNDITVDFNRNASFEATQKRLVNLFGEHGFSYDTACEERSAARTAWIKSICMYGVLFGAILSVFLLLQMHFCQMQCRRREAEFRMFRQLGMEWPFWGRMTVKEGLGQACVMLSGIPVSYVIMAGRVYMEYKKKKETTGLYLWSDSISEYTSDLLLHTTEFVRAHTSPAWSFLFGALLLLCVVLTGYQTAKHYFGRV